MCLDVCDNLTANGDIILAATDKYRAYNLLQNQDVFLDNPGISLDIMQMVQTGLDDSQIESLVIDYLLSFSCNLQNTLITSDKGNITFRFDFGG